MGKGFSAGHAYYVGNPPGLLGVVRDIRAHPTKFLAESYGPLLTNIRAEEIQTYPDFSHCSDSL